MTMTSEKIRIADIRVRDDHRPLKNKAIQAIASSIKEIGLKTPITIYRREKGYDLVSGHHRLKAMQSLGRKSIQAFVVDGPKIDARLWNVAENLHRAELSPLQRSQELKIWETQLMRSKVEQGAQPGGRQPNDKGISQTARRSGMSRDKVRRLRNIQNICPEAQAAAKKAALSQTALLKVAKESGRKAQVRKVAELANKKVERNQPLRWRELRHLRRLEKLFDAAKNFKTEWNEATVPARNAFIKTVLRSTGH